jgi:Zn ribbon nucleic-acid-binding protein
MNLLDLFESIDEGWQDFNKVEPYAVCLAGKPVKQFDYYEQARRFHDNWKQKLYREGNKEKADKITLMPLNLDEGWKSTLGGAALAGAMALGGAGAAQAQSSGPNVVNPTAVIQQIQSGKIQNQNDLMSALGNASNKQAVWKVLQNTAGMQGSNDVNSIIGAIGHRNAAGAQQPVYQNITRQQTVKSVNQPRSFVQTPRDDFEEAANPAQQAAIAIAKKKEHKVAEDANQTKRVFKDKAGNPVGEIGIDPESSPGNGEWYVHHYATGYSVVGFDSAAEAKRELMYVHKHPDAVKGHPSTKEQGVAEDFNTSSMGDAECPKCHQHDLSWEDDRQHVLCRNCGAEFEESGKEIKQGVAEGEGRVDPILIKALNNMPDGLATHGKVLNACYDAYAMELGKMAMKSEYGTTRAYIPQLMDLYKQKHGLTFNEDQGVTEGNPNSDPWYVYAKQNPKNFKKFKTYEAAKAYAEKHGLTCSSANYFHDKVNVEEVAPPGAKAERMVKHIKKSLSKDGHLSDKDKAIAYATTWKAHNDGKVEEAQTDYQKRRQRERDIDAGKPVPKQRQSGMTDYQKRRAEQKRQEELGEGEREPYQQAIDQLTARRIDDLNMKLDDLVQRAKQTKNPEVKAALAKEFRKHKAERDSYFGIDPATGMNADRTLGTVKGALDEVGTVTHTATGLKHQARPDTYGGYEEEPDHLARLDKHAVNRADKALGVKFDREKKYQGGLDIDEQSAPIKHRVAVTVTDPKHPDMDVMQRTCRVTGPDREKAINSAIAHYRREGFKVHDHHYIGVVDEGSMASAAHNSKGPKFGGYWKGTNPNPPKPGEGFGGCEESMEESMGPLGKITKHMAKSTWATTPSTKYELRKRRNPEQMAKRNGIAPVAEAKGLSKQVKIVQGPDAGKIGRIREIKLGAYKGAPKTYYIDLEDGGQANNLPGTALRLVKSEMTESLKKGEYYVWTVYFDDGTSKRIKVPSDEFDPYEYYKKQNKVVVNVDYNWDIQG